MSTDTNLPPGNDTCMAQFEEIKPPAGGRLDQVAPSEAQSLAGSRAIPTCDFAMIVDDTQKELEKEREEHQSTKVALEKAQQEAEKYRKSWKQSVNELNRHLRQGRGFNQLTDEELLRDVSELRFNIRSFAVQHFEHELGSVTIVPDDYDVINRYVPLHEQDFDAYIRNKTLRPDLMQAFIWRVFFVLIFDHKFRWAGNEAGTLMKKMVELFGPGYADNKTDARIADPLVKITEDKVPDPLRKFHSWRANTSTMLIHLKSLDENIPRDDVHDFATRQSLALNKWLCRFSHSDPEMLHSQLTDLIKQTVRLDQDLSRQVASIRWSFARGLSLMFNPSSMTLPSNYQVPSEALKVRLVLAPGITRRGRSSGDQFDKIVLLLKTEVTCEDPNTVLADLSSDGIMERVRKSYRP
ncbi:uncharacterized protein N7500_005213 [Penicillium coprophilum]|uniref:uncharacterized protein n=1 Tax=Penicillium coprophilum TaxID=36646 RepID=UPI0023921F99|nr:uncharacterized protein N7500_005213 [Penicillium coprophilum]KAJ5163383.1 hypothetical protein N7500_005213 [Penicillium coprophilum]